MILIQTHFGVIFARQVGTAPEAVVVVKPLVTLPVVTFNK